jgi:hypothetical protein
MEVERLMAMVFSPEISSSRERISCVSVLPRMVPITLVMKPSEGASFTLRWRARSRLRLAASMSFVASRPACLRVTSASVTGRGFATKVCQGAETAAKPERRAMREIPMIPTRSRHASLSPLPGWEAIVCIYVPGIPFPNHQNPISHIVKPHNCNSHAVFGNLPCSVLRNDHPEPDTMDCSSRKGTSTTRANSKLGTVTFKANVLAAGFNVFDISQRINSAKTAARAIVAEKVTATTLRLPDFAPYSRCFCRRLGGASLGR